MYTPDNYDFKESEIPITITTDGPESGINAGICLEPLPKRYTFEVHMWDKEASLPSKPTQVYFDEYITPWEYIPFADVTVTPAWTN